MLYDPKWEVPTKADPLSLDSLIAWIAKQPAHQVYCYSQPGTCLLSQYLSEAFDGEAVVDSKLFDIWRGSDWAIEDRPLPSGWDDIAQEHPRTFGAALERARIFASDGSL